MTTSRRIPQSKDACLLWEQVIDSDTFEDVAVLLLQQCLSGLAPQSARRYGKSGQAQEGTDVWAEYQPSACVPLVLHCKRRRSATTARRSTSEPSVRSLREEDSSLRARLSSSSQLGITTIIWHALLPPPPSDTTMSIERAGQSSVWMCCTGRRSRSRDCCAHNTIS